MPRLTCRTIVAGLIAGTLCLVGPETRLAPGGATGQEAARSAAPAQPVAAPSHTQPPAEPGDDEDATYRDALARKSIQENCLICHTEDMIAGQRLTEAQWKVEVDKMVGWGSPLPRESAAPLVEFLTRHYSDRTEPPVLTRVTLNDVDSLEVVHSGREPAPSKGDLGHGGQLYAANCATCHGPAALGGDLGPSLASKAILDHPKEYDQIVRQGLRRMPGFQAILKENDQADVLAWLRSRNYPE